MKGLYFRFRSTYIQILHWEWFKSLLWPFSVFCSSLGAKQMLFQKVCLEHLHLIPSLNSVLFKTHWWSQILTFLWESRMEARTHGSNMEQATVQTQDLISSSFSLLSHYFPGAILSMAVVKMSFIHRNRRQGSWDLGVTFKPSSLGLCFQSGTRFRPEVRIKLFPSLTSLEMTKHSLIFCVWAVLFMVEFLL